MTDIVKSAAEHWCWDTATTERIALTCLTREDGYTEVPISDSEYLPVFVYGTLKDGHSNAHILNGKGPRHTARCDILSMRDLGPFPMAFRTQFPQGIVGELVYVRPEDFEETMARLDMLESEGDFYERVAVAVHDLACSPPRRLLAWTYVMPMSDYARYADKPIVKEWK